MKTRATGLTALLLFLIALICLSSYALTRPSAIKRALVATSTQLAISNQIADATQNAQDSIEQTSVAASMTSFAFEGQMSTATQSAQEEIDQTATAASIAFSQTQTAIPPTFTSVPTQSACNATLSRDTILYRLPSDSLAGIELKNGTQLTVSGKLDDLGWYEVRSGSDIGWVPSTVLQGLDENCPTLYSIANAGGLDGLTILDDTFREGKGWYYVKDPEIRPERSRGQYDDFQLSVDSYFEETSISTLSLENLSTFDLVTSYYRENSDDQSYIGVRFGDANSSFTLYVYGDCSIEVKSSTGYSDGQPAAGSSNLCRDKSSDYLRVKWDGTDLVVWVNDTGLSNSFPLGSSYPTDGKVELITGEARAHYLFFALTSDN